MITFIKTIIIQKLWRCWKFWNSPHFCYLKMGNKENILKTGLDIENHEVYNFRWVLKLRQWLLQSHSLFSDDTQIWGRNKVDFPPTSGAINYSKVLFCCLPMAETIRIITVPNIYWIISLKKRTRKFIGLFKSPSLLWKKCLVPNLCLHLNLYVRIVNTLNIECTLLLLDVQFHYCELN